MTRCAYPADSYQVAIQGCSHGSLSAIYDSLAQYTAVHSRPVDLLLLCGDFQALRSVHDFPSLAVPPKYHALGTFHEYYSGKRVAPVLTLVIGGNHEASNYMWELYHGGWLAPNIYYLGAAGSVLVDGLRIVGASGIYKDHDYGKGGSKVGCCCRFAWIVGAGQADWL
jgi:lariat debranching enzyme